MSFEQTNLGFLRHVEAKCVIFKLGFKRKCRQDGRLQWYTDYTRIIPCLSQYGDALHLLLDCTIPVRGKRKAVKMMHDQVTWLQLVLSVFRLERDNNKWDCSQQALFLTENLLTLCYQQYTECMLSSHCGMMRNNANAFGNWIPGCCVSVSLITQVTKDSPTQREYIGFHVEQRGAWWGNIKLVVLTKSAGKVIDTASLGSRVNMMLL